MQTHEVLPVTGVATTHGPTATPTVGVRRAIEITPTSTGGLPTLFAKTEKATSREATRPTKMSRGAYEVATTTSYFFPVGPVADEV